MLVRRVFPFIAAAPIAMIGFWLVALMADVTREEISEESRAARRKLQEENVRRAGEVQLAKNPKVAAQQLDKLEREEGKLRELDKKSTGWEVAKTVVLSAVTVVLTLFIYGIAVMAIGNKTKAW